MWSAALLRNREQTLAEQRPQWVYEEAGEITVETAQASVQWPWQALLVAWSSVAWNSDRWWPDVL